MRSIGVDGLCIAVGDILDDYVGATLDDVQEAVDETARQCLADIRSNIDAQGLVKTGDYRKSWSSKKLSAKNRWGYGKLIFSKTPYLPHLLEHGHAKVNGGRVAGREHLAPADRAAAENFLRILKARIQGG